MSLSNLDTQEIYIYTERAKINIIFICQSYYFGEGNGNPLQYSCLENPMDRGDWWATVHGVAESDTTEPLHFHLLFSLFRHTKNLFIIVGILFSLQVRDLSIAYMLVTLTYLYIGVLVFASFPSPPLSKDCIEQVRHCVPSLCDCLHLHICKASSVIQQQCILPDRPGFESSLFYLPYMWEFRHLPRSL